VAAANTGATEIAFQANRLLFMVDLPEWKVFGIGWARRLMTLAFSASTLPVP
jgi:hypothetical protein